MTVTSDEFLTGLKSRVTFPANQAQLTDTNLLSMADKVIKDKLVPLILSVNQNYFVVDEFVPTVAAQEKYAISYRAIGRALRDLKLVNSSQSQNTFSMALIALEDEHLFQNQAVPTSFFFKGDNVILRPVPINAQYNLQFYFNLQPNDLVPVSSAAEITGISSNVVTCSSIPSTFTSTVLVDFIKGKAGSTLLDWDVQVTNATSTQLTFAAASDIPSDLAVGDWVALAQESPVINLPDEAVPLLETLVGARVLYAMGDFDGSNLLKSEAAEEEQNFLKIIEPRVEGEQTKIVNRNGLLRGRGFNCFRNRGGYYF